MKSERNRFVSRRRGISCEPIHDDLHSIYGGLGRHRGMDVVWIEKGVFSF
jgi:hypothetical protein